WPISRAGEALDALARASGVASPTASSAVTGAPPMRDEEAQKRWLDAEARRLGLEVEPVDVGYAEINRLIRSSAPALLKVRHEDSWSLLLLVSTTRRSVLLLAPDLRKRRVAATEIRAVLVGDLERPVAAEIDALLEDVAVARRRRAGVRRALLKERVASRRI